MGLKNNEILSVNSTLGKSRRKKTKPARKKNEPPSQDNGTAKLKTVLLILPFVIIAVAVAALIAGIRQYSAMFAPVEEKSHQESESDYDEPDDEKLLMIVSPDNPLPSDYKIDLTSVGSVKVDRCIASQLESMLASADKDGMRIELSGGYVSAETQHSLFTTEVSRLTAKEGYGEARAMEEAENTVPMENHSEFQSGLAIRLTATGQHDFKNTDEYLWLMRNAAEYGFILRYPEGRESKTGFSFDPTHFRYVGKENAIKMKTFNMTLDEYVYYLDKRS